MKVLTPRNSFSLAYTPEQCVGICNTLLLLFVTFMFGLVVFNMNSLDQRLISVLDSSVVAIDLIATDLLQSQTTPYWRTINEDISVYSAFYHDTQRIGGNSVLLVGSRAPDTVSIEDLRCLIKYEGEDDINIASVDYRKLSNCSSTVFLYCNAKGGVLPKKVALVSYRNTIPKQWMEVKTFRTGVEGPTKIAACVRPFSGGESAQQVAEFIAFYETIGVSHFYFYNQNAGHNVVDFTLQLKGMGHSINLLPWNKQDGVTSDCPISLSEHVQDCSLRAADKYSYILTVDVSDFVVPSEHFGLPALVEDANVAYRNFSQLRMTYAKFCEAPNSYFRSDDPLAIRRMTFRGGIQLSNSNYVLRLEPVLPAAHQPSLTGRLANRTQVVETLPANEVMVHHHSEKCESGGMLDLSAYKYMSLVDQSNVLQTYKQTLRGKSNQITFAST